MNERNPLFAVLVASILLISAAAPVFAETINVPGGSQDAIQAAVDQAGAGGTVILAKGDHIVSQTVFLRQNGIRVVGKKGSEILVEGTLSPVFEITASHAELSGVRVWVPPTAVGDVFLAAADRADHLNVNKCRAEGIVQLVTVADSYDVTIRGNRVVARAPRETPALAVIHVEAGGTCKIAKNDLAGPRMTGSAGISAVPFELSTHLLTGNTVTGFDTGIVADGDGVAEIRGNRIRGSVNGMIIGGTIPAFLWEISKNRVEETLAAGIYLENGQDCLVAGNRVAAAGTNGIDVGGVRITLRRNKCRLNAGYGIYVEAANCHISHCAAHRNGHGVRVQGSANRIQGVRTKLNIGDGIIAVGGNVNAGGNRSWENGGVQFSVT